MKKSNNKSSLLPFLLLLVVLVNSLALSACSTTSPSTQYYILPSDKNIRVDETEEFTITSKGDIIHIAVLPAELPEYLRRSQIFRKKLDSASVSINDYDRWAEDLGAAFQRVLTTSLDNDLINTNMHVTPQIRGVLSDYTLNIYINAFEGDFNSDVVLDAYWTLQQRNDLTVTEYFYKTTNAGASYTSLIEAQSMLVDDMATEISKALLHLESSAIIK